uniref:major capsid protein n=1 Tax=Pseudomonas viridiflava TaxID=33069 RepID=UPI001F11FDCD
VLVTDTAPTDVIFGLLPSAVPITESQAPGFRSYEVNDEENLAIGYRAEGVVNIDVLGYSWKETAGGANPSLAAVGSSANWVKHSASDKVTAGVMIELTPAA